MPGGWLAGVEPKSPPLGKAPVVAVVEAGVEEVAAVAEAPKAGAAPAPDDGVAVVLPNKEEPLDCGGLAALPNRPAPPPPA